MSGSGGRDDPLDSISAAAAIRWARLTGFFAITLPIAIAIGLRKADRILYVDAGSGVKITIIVGAMVSVVTV